MPIEPVNGDCWCFCGQPPGLCGCGNLDITLCASFAVLQGWSALDNLAFPITSPTGQTNWAGIFDGPLGGLRRVRVEVELDCCVREDTQPPDCRDYLAVVRAAPYGFVDDAGPNWGCGFVWAGAGPGSYCYTQGGGMAFVSCSCAPPEWVYDFAIRCNPLMCAPNCLGSGANPFADWAMVRLTIAACAGGGS